MIAASATLEERLLHGYGAQLKLYNATAEILGNARAGQLHESSNDNRWAHTLHATLQEAATLAAAMADDIASWRELGQPPGVTLKGILGDLAQRIQYLSEGIDQQITEMRSRQQGLASEIDELIQNRRMLQAYGSRG